MVCFVRYFTSLCYEFFLVYICVRVSGSDLDLIKGLLTGRLNNGNWLKQLLVVQCANAEYESVGMPP